MLLQRFVKTGLFARDVQQRFKGTTVDKADAVWLKTELQKMGPTYVKIGQFISSRRDVFNKSVVDALRDLQDNVEPLNRDVAKLVLESNLPLKQFKSIELEAFASASIGQVHRGVLKNGKWTAIKVKRPSIETVIDSDIRVLNSVLKVMESVGLANVIETRDILDDFRDFVIKEANYFNEVQNMQMFLKYNADNPYVKLPKLYEEYCNGNVIVMEYVPSIKLNDLKDHITKEQRSTLAYRLMDLFVQQFINDGIIHGDPHEGNMGVCQDGRLVLYDLGHMISIDAETKALMKQLFFEIMVENVDAALDVVKRLDKLFEIRDEQALRSYMQKYVKYIKSLDVNVFKLNEDEVYQTLPVKFDGVIFRLIRVFGLVEGICKELDPEFSYTNVFLKYLDTLLVDSDFIDYKIKADVKTLLKGVTNNL